MSLEVAEKQPQQPKPPAHLKNTLKHMLRHGAANAGFRRYRDIAPLGFVGRRSAGFVQGHLLDICRHWLSVSVRTCHPRAIDTTALVINVTTTSFPVQTIEVVPSTHKTSRSQCTQQKSVRYLGLAKTPRLLWSSGRCSQGSSVSCARPRALVVRLVRLALRQRKRSPIRSIADKNGASYNTTNGSSIGASTNTRTLGLMLKETIT